MLVYTVVSLDLGEAGAWRGRQDRLAARSGVEAAVLWRARQRPDPRRCRFVAAFAGALTLSSPPSPSRPGPAPDARADGDLGRARGAGLPSPPGGGLRDWTFLGLWEASFEALWLPVEAPDAAGAVRQAYEELGEQLGRARLARAPRLLTVGVIGARRRPACTAEQLPDSFWEL
ncbi:hypothetical protein SAMN06265365_11079 [Tistlia consotensis]|uniref:Uncharacterized protein n=1 Tax=Tistlia consotensis USBA 355 TaxID=560819 RepID=A0A1Y6BYD0_9PROT|nr:hypothetical protein [Tistlia consotensis]SMF27325.1 hypothetical protein SAMN05428998_10977 [Tistlia consotensis USBA 355]SNR66241.1 hypothetical protein SAMN06265365_11079 [Tistlia consotensis]